MLARLAVAARGLKIAAPEVQAFATRLSQPLSDISNQREASTATSPVSRVKELKTDQEYSSVLQAADKTNALSAFQFTAAWCGPCKMISPLVEQLSDEYGEISFYKVDIDRSTIHETVASSGITSVPTFSFYRGAKKIATFSGADKRQLENNVVNLVALGA